MGKKAQEPPIESINQSQINQSISEQLEEPIAVSTYPETHELSRPEKVEIQKDSLQLGIAAGYTGRSLREIESSLHRIEAQMTTKDWFMVNFEDKTPQLIELLKKHDENEEQRFEVMQKTLLSLRGIAMETPEPHRTEILTRIQTLEGQLHLRPKMQRLIESVKEAKEISYADLAQKLNISQDGLRGLVSETLNKTNKLEKLKKERKVFLHYIGD